MSSTKWIVLVVVVAVGAFALGYYASTIKTVIDNRKRIGGGLKVLEGLGDVLG